MLDPITSYSFSFVLQGRIYECMNKSVADEILSSSLFHALAELQSETGHFLDQQHWVRNSSLSESMPISN